MIRNILKRIYFFRSFGELNIKKFMIIAAWDILFLLAVIGITASFTAALRLNLDSLAKFNEFTPELENIITHPQKQMESVITDEFRNNFNNVRKAMDFFLVKMVIVIIAYLAILAIALGAIKGKGYSILTGREFNKKFFIKFSLSSLVWILLWAVVLSITIFGVKIPYNTIPIMVEIVILFISCPLFFGFCSEETSPLMNVRVYLKLILLRSYRFILSFIMILLFLGFSLLILLIAGIFIKNAIYYFIMPLFIISFSVWAKTYIYLIAKETWKEL